MFCNSHYLGLGVSMASDSRFGEGLVNKGLISLKQLQEAIQQQEQNKGTLAKYLVKLGFVKEKELLPLLEKYYGVPSIDLNSFQIDKNVVQLVSREVCERYQIIPISKGGDTLVVAFSDPSNLMIKDDLYFITRMKIRVVLASELSIEASINKYYAEKMAFKSDEAEGYESDEGFEFGIGKTEDIARDTDQSGVVKFVNQILDEAVRKGVSDIHFEPYEKRLRIRYRLDGDLISVAEPPRNIASAVASRIKIVSGMNIAEKRRPQDGRLKIKSRSGKEIDFRVSSVPTMFGEKVVMRLLDKSTLQLDMTKLGFEPDDLKLFKDTIKLPWGMILVTGPTGSGKTVTIYSALSELNQPNVNICTAEDPIEFNLDGINQVQMNSEIDLTFANALRSFLRQDPDIVMVGEIRDLETAEIAMKAASTGHLVVSTLHTNDAPSAIARLTDMGIPSYIITSCVSLVVAQRLVGKICENCKEEIKIKKELLDEMGVKSKDYHLYQHVYKGRGCNNCEGTGIKGRLAIYELMLLDYKLKELILNGVNESQLKEQAVQSGMRTLRGSALLKLQRGLTTVEDVLNTSVAD